MNSEKKTPQEELLEEIKDAEKTAEKTSDKESKQDKKACSKKKKFNSRRFKHGGAATAFTAVFVVVVILVNVVVSLISERFPSINVDMTANHVNTLSEEALKVAKEVKEETFIHILATDDWINYADSQGAPYSVLISLSDKLAEANSKIKVDQIDLEKNPAFVNKYSDEKLNYGHVVVETQKRYRVLTVDDMFPAESNMQTNQITSYNDVDSALATAVKQVNLEEVPIVSIAVGHNEMLGRQFESLAAFFNQNAFDVEEFNIMSDEIPEKTQLLLLLAPSTDYTEEELKKLDAYLSEKESGKTRTLMISAMPGQANLPNLMGFLEEWGISYDPASVVLESNPDRYFRNPVLYLSDIAAGNPEKKEDPIPGPSYPLLLTPSSVPVECLFDSQNGIVTKPIAFTSEGAYVQKADSDKDISETAEKKSYNTVVVARKALDSSGLGAFSNVVMLGSTMMLDPSTINTNTFSNGTYLSDLAKFATGSSNTDNTVYSPRVQSNVMDMTATTSVINFLGLGVFTIAIPAIILLTGLIVYIKRRHL